MEPTDLILYDVADRVATVTLNRPDKLNALNRATLAALDDAIRRAGSDSDVGVIILTGAGSKAFAAGADIAEMTSLSATEGEEYSRFGQGVFDRIERLGKPVIAAIQGFALGGGCELAMAAHLRVAAESAQLGQPEVNLGLIPGFAGTQRLGRLVGAATALDLILTGRRVRADEALRLGLISRVVAGDGLMEEVRRLASEILGKGPRAVAYSLEAVRRGMEAGFDEGARLESSLFGLLFSTADMKEGTSAFMEKRKPEFTGR